MKWFKPPWRAEPDNIAHWSYPFIGIILPFVVMLRTTEFESVSVLFLFSVINLIFNRGLLMTKLNQSSDRPILATLEKYKRFSLIMFLITIIVGFASAVAAYAVLMFAWGLSLGVWY